MRFDLFWMSAAVAFRKLPRCICNLLLLAICGTSCLTTNAMMVIALRRIELSASLWRVAILLGCNSRPLLRFGQCALVRFAFSDFWPLVIFLHALCVACCTRAALAKATFLLSAELRECLLFAAFCTGFHDALPSSKYAASAKRKSDTGGNGPNAVRAAMRILRQPDARASGNSPIRGLYRNAR